MTELRKTWIADATTGDTANVCSHGHLEVHQPSLISTVNSSTTPLNAGVTFTGTSEDIKNYSGVLVTVYTDQVSATDGLSVQFSPDGTNWDNIDVYTIAASTGKTFSIQPSGRYCRVLYTNGGVNQSAFRLTTTYLHQYTKPSSHRIADSISAQDDAELVKAVLTGEDPDAHFHNVAITHDGSLKTADGSSGLAIAKGEVSDHSFIHKFGQAPDFDIADGLVTVWDGAEDGVAWENMVYDYSATANIDTLSSDTAGDTEDIEIQGLDSSYNLVTQTITLTGTTKATLTTSLIRIFRMKNVGSNDLVGHVFCYVDDTTTTPGIPDTPGNIRAIIHPGNNQTLMAVYTIPLGYTGYMRDWYASTAGAKRDSQHTIKILARPFGQVFQVKHVSNISVTGSSHIQHKYTEPEVFAAKTDIEIQADTDTDIAGVAAGFDIVLVAD